MPAGLALLKSHTIQIAISLGSVAIGVSAAWLMRKRVPAEELERERRLTVHQHGRIIDGGITEINEDMIPFEYCINGVDYQATQYVASIRDLLPAQPHRVIGPVTLKYIS